MHETLPFLPDLCAEGQVRLNFCEIFAGCGRLSRAAKKLGFATLPVDGPRNEHKPECKILTLDLMDAMCQQMLLEKPAKVATPGYPCGSPLRNWHLC